MKKIQVRAYFGWHDVNKEQAKKFIEDFINNMPNVSTYLEKVEIVNRDHLKGITVQELLK